jgi:hypothetical protein
MNMKKSLVFLPMALFLASHPSGSAVSSAPIALSGTARIAGSAISCRTSRAKAVSVWPKSKAYGPASHNRFCFNLKQSFPLQRPINTSGSPRYSPCFILVDTVGPDGKPADISAPARTRSTPRQGAARSHVPLAGLE